MTSTGCPNFLDPRPTRQDDVEGVRFLAFTRQSSQHVLKRFLTIASAMLADCVGVSAENSGTRRSNSRLDNMDIQSTPCAPRG